MNAVVCLLALAAAGTEQAAAPQVRSLLVTHLGFEEKDRDKIAAAAVKLLARCRYSCPFSETDFESIFRQCHLDGKFAEPREVTADRQKVKVDEFVVSFPTNTGGIWVRTGTDYRYFTKFDCEQCLALHELLKAGKPQ